MEQRNEAIELLRRIDARQEKLITVLIGDLDHESPRARLPMLEAASQKHADDIDKLQTSETRIWTFSAIISFVVMALGRMIFRPNIDLVNPLGIALANFDVALEELLKDEGGFANNPHDAGGITVFGISRTYNPIWLGWIEVDRLRIQHPNLVDLNLAMRQSSYVMTAVANFYRSIYWNFDAVKDQAVANRMLLMEVNFGKGGAVRILQQALIRLGAQIHLDGSLGPSTLLALESANGDDLTHALRTYSALARIHKVIKDPDQIVFAEGWLWRDLA